MGKLTDLARETFRQILEDLCDRGGIKHELQPFRNALLYAEDEDDPTLETAREIEATNMAFIEAAFRRLLAAEESREPSPTEDSE